MSDTSGVFRSARTGRFLKGNSGNPKGRPRKQTPPADAPRSAFEIVLNKRVTATQGGIERELTVEEALQFRIYEDALAGKRPAVREVLKMIAKREKAIADSGHRKLPFGTWKELMDPINADAAMCLLGIAALDVRRKGWDAIPALLLEPWAVQAALSRRRGSKALTPKDIGEINRCTRAAHTLR